MSIVSFIASTVNDKNPLDSIGGEEINDAFDASETVQSDVVLLLDQLG